MIHFETIHSRKTRLAIIADDITGAFDTGVQFSKRGACVKVLMNETPSRELLGADVIVIDAELRPLTQEEAYRRTYRWTQVLSAWNIPHIYVKTDSGLRGNIGPAIKAVLDATGEELAVFAPAYPDMRRTTRNGCQFIDGKPIRDSVFGHDPFEPVRVSRISELFRGYDCEVQECKPGEIPLVRGQTVAIFDAEHNADFLQIARTLGAEGRLRVTAGCAAFAAALPTFFDLPDYPQEVPAVLPPLMVLCGSLNPITRRQFEYGEELGYERVTLSQRQLLEEDYWQGEEGKRWLESVARLIGRGRPFMIDTGLSAPTQTDISYKGMKKAEIRTRIASRLGDILNRLLTMDGAQAYMPMIIGGDTLMGFLKKAEKGEIILKGEVDAGVVMFSVKRNGKERQMLSKSGGFGERTLLGDVIMQKAVAR